MEKIDKQFAVVFGGAGFIGRALCKEIIRDNKYELLIVDSRCTSNSDPLPPELSARLRQFDAASAWQMKKFAEETRDMNVKYVYNLATLNQELAEIEPEDAAQSNIAAAKLITDYAENHRAELIYTSSVSVYGNQNIPLTELTPVMPVTLYGATKLAGEFISKRAMYHHIYRLSNVYGPGMLLNSPWCGVVGKFLLAAEQRKQFIITQRLGTTRNYTYIDDVIDAIYEPCGSSYRTYNISSDETTTLEELVELIRDGRDLTLKFVPSRPCDTVSVRKVVPSNMFGEWRPWKASTKLSDGIKKTRLWIQSELSLPLTP